MIFYGESGIISIMGKKTNKAYNKLLTPIYTVNIVIQAIVSLASPIAVMFFGAYLLDRYTEVGGWIYVVGILLGVGMGLYSMVVFILRASRALEAIEKQNSTSERK